MKDKRTAMRLLGSLQGETEWFSKLQRELYLTTRGRVFLSGRSQLQSWKRQTENSSRGDGCRKRLRGENVGEDDVGSELYRWFSSLRAQNLRVSVATTKLKARTLKGESVTRKWFSKWKKRHSIVLRSVQRRTTKTHEQIVACIQGFHQFLYSIRLSRCIAIIINFDEIPFSFSGSMNSNSTLSERGTTNVMVSEDPNWDRRCCSFIASVAVINEELGILLCQYVVLFFCDVLRKNLGL